MRNNTIIGAIVLIIVVGGLFWYALGRPTGQPGGAPSAATFTVPALSPYTEETDLYTIAANYPTTTPLEGNLNDGALALMRGWVSDTITQFKKDGNFANLTPEDKHLLGFDQGRRYSLTVAYLFGTSENTLSYIFTIYEDTGGAHGNTFFKTFTFDTRTGAVLSLADLFTPGSDYLATLSQISRSRLPDIIGAPADFTAIKDGTTPEAKNFQNFFFDGTDFVVLFPPYQVAAYAAGPQTLRIQKSQLFDILKTAYH